MTRHKFIIRYHLPYTISRHQKHQRKRISALLDIILLPVRRTVMRHRIRIYIQMIKLMGNSEMLSAFRLIGIDQHKPAVTTFQTHTGEFPGQRAIYSQYIQFQEQAFEIYSLGIT